MTETVLGIIAAVVIIFLTLWLDKYFTAKLIAATTLVAIGFIYVGFSLKGNPVSLITLEVGVALVLYFVAITGYQRNASLIAFGIIFHGIWDIVHHNGLPVQTDIPGYWPTFCFTIDIIDGLFFLFLFRTQKKAGQLFLNTIGKPVSDNF